jgi:hypothetical protein
MTKVLQATGLILLLSCAGLSGRPAHLPPLRPTPKQVEVFVAGILADRFQAGDIPDQELVMGEAPVFLFDEMEETGYLLTPASLPIVPGKEFRLLSRSGGDGFPHGTRIAEHMLFVDQVALATDAATALVGVRDDKGVLASAWGTFSRRGDSWSFVKWSDTCYHCVGPRPRSEGDRNVSTRGLGAANLNLSSIGDRRVAMRTLGSAEGRPALDERGENRSLRVARPCKLQITP